MTDPELDLLAEHVVRSGAAPAAAVASAWRAENRWQIGLGAAGAARRDSAEAPIFDLASVSKPFVAAAAARAVRRNLLTLSDPLSRWVPELARSAARAAPIELLLAHRAGLEAHRPLFAPLSARALFQRTAALESAADARRSECSEALPAAGHAPLYSDLGYVLAGEMIERAAGCPLDDFVLLEVSNPLGLHVRSARQWLRTGPGFFSRVMPTEVVPWRGGVLDGVVHDENAWALAGHGLAGQAGLFGTAEAVARFGVSMLDAMAGRRLDWLAPAEVLPLVRRRPGGTLRAGFDGKAEQQSSAGSVASQETFGHLGFTGTSFWCDPVAESVAVLLTNRVCPSRENQKIREARPAVHDALFRYARQRGLPSRA